MFVIVKKCTNYAEESAHYAWFFLFFFFSQQNAIFGELLKSIIGGEKSIIDSSLSPVAAAHVSLYTW